MKQEDKETLKKVQQKMVFHQSAEKDCAETVSCTQRPTCNELNTAKIYRKTKECELTARMPKIQEMPRMGRRTATAFAVNLETSQSKSALTFVTSKESLVLSGDKLT